MLTAPLVKNSFSGTIEAQPVVLSDDLGNYLSSLGGSVSATATAAAPTYTEGNSAAPLSLTLNGALRTQDTVTNNYLATLVSYAADANPSVVKIDQTTDGTTNKVSIGGDTINVQSAAPATAQTVTITNGTSLSGAVDLTTQRLHRIVMSAGWTAANITFQASYDGTNFNDLYDTSGEVTVTTAAANRSIVVDQSVFYGIRYLKIRSGTSGTPVNQTADRALILATVPR